MTARQQIARLLPLVLLVILVAAGLRGEVLAPRWNGPLKSDGVPIGLALEVILGALLVVTLRRDAAAARVAKRRPYTGEAADVEPAVVLRFALKWLLGACMVAVAVILIIDLHLHFFGKATPLKLPASPGARAEAADAVARPWERLDGAHPARPHPLRAARRRARRGRGDQHLVVRTAAATRRAAGHRGRERRGTAGSGGVGTRRAGRDRRRAGRDHRLLRGDGAQPGRARHPALHGRHPGRAARPRRRRGNRPRTRRQQADRPVLRGAVLHPSGRGRPAGRRERGARRACRRAGRGEGRRARHVGQSHVGHAASATSATPSAPGAGGGWV